MLTGTALRNCFAVALLSAVALSTAGEAAPPRERDHGYNGCHAQTNRCLMWCINNRTGDEQGKCISNCHKYEDKCYAKASKAGRASDIAPASPADPAANGGDNDEPAADSAASKKKRAAEDNAKRKPR